MSDPTNTEIAAALDELGDLTELDGAAIYRTNAYRNAAKAVRESSVSVLGLARQGRATELPGIGATIQEKIIALADEGAIPAAVKLRAKFPPGLLAMTHLPGLGPKRARRLYDELGIDSLEALRGAAENHQIRTLKGFGPKAEEAILASVRLDGAGERPARVVLSRALAIGEPLVAALRAHPASGEVELAGSARRMTDTVKDLDVIATASDPLALARAAAELDLVEHAGTPATAGLRLRTHTGIAVDLRIVEHDQFGNLLQHLTGSKQHNMALREAAVRKGLHVSEYGVLDDATGETHRCATEHEVYALLGLEYIEPELRENRGELAAAAAGTLPKLIERSDLRGDLHSHTTASDGTASIEEMALAARDFGYEYLAITDHSASFGFGDEVSPERLREQIARIRATDIDGIELLAGSEVNILPDGSLDYPDELLAELDWVIASVHSSFRMSSGAMTDRVDPRDRTSDGRRHRPSDGAQARAPRPVCPRRRARDRRRGTHGHDARDQLQPRPPGPQRHPRARRRIRRRADRDQLGLSPRGRVRGRALRDRDRAPRLADRRAGGQHRAVARHRGDPPTSPRRWFRGRRRADGRPSATSVARLMTTSSRTSGQAACGRGRSASCA